MTRPGSFPPSLPAQLADALRRIAELERRAHTGTGVSTAFRGINTRTMQPGFPAELTGVWESAGSGTAYPWKALALEGDVIDNPDVQLTGTLAVTPDNNEDLASGTRGWMETDPQAGGYVFIADAAELTPTPVTSPTTGEPLPAPSSSGISGWTADTCLVMGVVDAGTGLCSTVDRTQKVYMTGGPATWNSVNDFSGTGSGGDGPVVFNRTTPTPTATIDGVGGFSLGPVPGGWLFEFNTTTLCGAPPVPCDDWFRAAFMCVACAVESGSYSARTLTLTTPALGSNSTRFIVPPQSSAAAAIRLCLSVPCTGGLSNLLITLTAPGNTVYTLFSNPASLTAQTGEFILLPGAAVAVNSASQSSGTFYGTYSPDDDFTAYTGPSTGVWTLTITNSGPCAALLTCANLCFGAVSSGLSAFTLTATPTSGSTPLTVTLGATITGTPRFYSIDWGDGSALAWVLTPVGVTHSYSTADDYEIVVRAYGECGGYVEDSVFVAAEAPITVSCTGSPVPATLNWEIDTITGDCSCIVTTSGTATYDSMNGWWGDVAFACLLGVCEENATYRMSCQAGGWEYGTSGGGFSATSVTASPFEVVFAGKPGVGVGSYRIRFYA